jgi:hypothetical protein
MWKKTAIGFGDCVSIPDLCKMSQLKWRCIWRIATEENCSTGIGTRLALELEDHEELLLWQLTLYNQVKNRLQSSAIRVKFRN